MNDYVTKYFVKDLTENGNFNKTIRLVEFLEKNWDFGKH